MIITLFFCCRPDHVETLVLLQTRTNLANTQMGDHMVSCFKFSSFIPKVNFHVTNTSLLYIFDFRFGYLETNLNANDFLSSFLCLFTQNVQRGCADRVIDNGSKQQDGVQFPQGSLYSLGVGNLWKNYESTSPHHVNSRIDE